jgi:chorismate mutase/prephenate dehydratase
MLKNKLLSLRNRIDAVDDQVWSLLNERARLAQHIGHLKNGIVYKPGTRGPGGAPHAIHNPAPCRNISVSCCTRRSCPPAAPWSSR